MDINEAKQVLDDYKKGVATPDQAKMVENWYMAISRAQELNSDEANFSDLEDNIWEVILKKTGLDTELNNHRTAKLWPRIVAAASILICLSAGFYFYKQLDVNQLTKSTTINITPGGNKAYLTLADGKRITLTDIKNGELAKQSGVKITKTGDGQLVYIVSNLSNGNNNVIAYNTIETPNGGQYQVILPDGSKVWLNAASSLKFPSSFSRLVNRRVELLRGEAYFEVAKDKKHPFIVQTDQQEVKVLGTHFNINSYLDEKSVKTTLIEGIVQVSNASFSKVLKPGEQSINNGEDIGITKINTESVIAWRNGNIIFENQELITTMRQISRWYDVDVIFESQAPIHLKLGGLVPRSNPLSATLKAMEATGKVKFKIEGRRIIVLKE